MGDERFRALVALAGLEGRSPRWAKRASGLLDDLLKSNPLHLGVWVNGLRPVRDALLPAVTARLTVDNTKGKTLKTAFFALHFTEPGARPLPLGSPQRMAFAHRREFGVAAELFETGSKCAPADKPFLFQQWNLGQGLRDINPVLMLCSAAGFAFEVPAGKSYELVIAIGSYLDLIP